MVVFFNVQIILIRHIEYLVLEEKVQEEDKGEQYYEILLRDPSNLTQPFSKEF